MLVSRLRHAGAVRVVVALAPGHGHLYPTLGLAKALVGRGHHVAYAMVDEPSLRERVEGEGHSFVAVPPTLAVQREIVEQGLREDPTLAGIFGPLAPPAVEALVDLIGTTDARLVLHDMATFAAPLAAAVAGCPSAHVGVGPSFPDEAIEAGRRLEPLWAKWGQEPDALAGMFRRAYLDPFPPSLDNPVRSLGVPGQGYQSAPLGLLNGAAEVSLPEPPWVWATLGTVFNANPSAWRRLVEALEPFELPVLATVGHGVAPGLLAEGARNVRVLSFVPASVMLAGAVGVLCHGGAGTVLGALRHGLPLVCWPQGADQFHNARACEDSGAGLTIDGPAEAADALRRVLGQDEYRSAARRLQAEILAMPSLEETVGFLEDLAAGQP
jgi:UDP:flavonoid glycosyltransferase YjiC (YdhE family)